MNESHYATSVNDEHAHIAAHCIALATSGMLGKKPTITRHGTRVAMSSDKTKEIGRPQGNMNFSLQEMQYDPFSHTVDDILSIEEQSMLSFEQRKSANAFSDGDVPAFNSSFDYELNSLSNIIEMLEGDAFRSGKGALNDPSNATSESGECYFQSTISCKTSSKAQWKMSQIIPMDYCIMENFRCLDEHIGIKEMAACINKSCGEEIMSEHIAIRDLARGLCTTVQSDSNPLQQINNVSYATRIAMENENAGCCVMQNNNSNEVLTEVNRESYYFDSLDDVRLSFNERGPNQIQHPVSPGCIDESDVSPTKASTQINLHESKATSLDHTFRGDRKAKASVGLVENNLSHERHDTIVSAGTSDIRVENSVNAHQKQFKTTDTHCNPVTSQSQTFQSSICTRGNKRVASTDSNRDPVLERGMSPHFRDCPTPHNPDQLNPFEVPIETTRVAIDGREAGNFTGDLNRKLKRTGSTTDASVMIEMHGSGDDSFSCTRQEKIVQSSRRTVQPSMDFEMMEPSFVAPEKVVEEGWKPFQQKLALFENLHDGSHGDKSYSVCSNVEKSEMTSFSCVVEPSLVLNRCSVQDITESRREDIFASSSSHVQHIKSAASLSGNVHQRVGVASVSVSVSSNPMVGECTEICKPGKLTSAKSISSDVMDTKKTTFEQRREKELDDILHVLQATVQSMEEDCRVDESKQSWKSFSHSTSLLDSHGHCFSLSSDETSGEDFVSPPLPPPPSAEDLASFGGSLSGSQKTESPPPIPTVVSPTYKASANFSVWSPGGNRKSSQDGGQVEVGSKSTANTGPTGFRSVRPMLKSYSAQEGCHKVPSHHYNIHIPSVGLKTKSMLENYPPASGTLLSNARPSAHFANAAESTFRHSQVPEMHRNLQLVTLLRDTRKILIKSDKSPAPSTVTTSYNFPESRTTLPEQSANVKITPKNQLPNGAVYETKTVDGDMVHTDTYYPAADGGTVLERTKKTTVVKAEYHRGMGPTDNQGVPIALRSTVDNPKAWYKNMFKQIHKVEQEDDKDFTRNDHPPEENHKPIVSNAPTYRPKRLGRITDYTPSEPYVVESKPKKSQADYSSWSSKEITGNIDAGRKPGSNNAAPVKPVPKISWLLENHENGNRIPPASTSYNPPRNHQQKAVAVKTDRVEPVHGTEYEVKDLPLADHVVIETKHVVVMNTSKSKEPKREEGRRQNARAKFDFVAQSSKQLGFKKDQIIVITKTINKDWYEGETPDRKSSGMFPVSYVEVLGEAEKRAKRKGAAKAKFDFAGTNPKQLSIQKGDSLELIEKVDKNWYKAAIGQKTGIVPSNYIEVISEPETAGPKSTAAPVPKVKSPVSKDAPDRFKGQGPASPPPSGDPEDKAKITRAAFLANEVVNSGAKLSKPRPSQGEYDIPELTDAALGFQSETDGKRTSQVSTVSSSGSSNQAEDPAKLTAYGTPAATSVDARVSASVANVDASVSASVDASDDFPVLREKFVAIYRYDPQNEDELELAPGDAVQVVEKCDDGWFVGTCERTGAFGTFPGNYVTIA